MSPFEAFEEAVRRARGQAPLARIIGVTQGAVWQRLKAKKPVAGKWALKIEAATGVPKEALCPDIYPLPDRRTLRRDNADGTELEPAR